MISGRGNKSGVCDVIVARQRVYVRKENSNCFVIFYPLSVALAERAMPTVSVDRREENG